MNLRLAIMAFPFWNVFELVSSRRDIGIFYIAIITREEELLL